VVGFHHVRNARKKIGSDFPRQMAESDLLGKSGGKKNIGIFSLCGDEYFIWESVQKSPTTKLN